MSDTVNAGGSVRAAERQALTSNIRPVTAAAPPNSSMAHGGVPVSSMTSASPTGSTVPSPVYAPLPTRTRPATASGTTCAGLWTAASISGRPAPRTQPKIGPPQTVMPGLGFVEKSVLENVAGWRTIRSTSAPVANPAMTCPASWVHWSQSHENASSALTMNTWFRSDCRITWVLRFHENRVVLTDAAAHSHLARLQSSTTCGAGCYRCSRNSVSKAPPVPGWVHRAED